jgi:hypothetical protein
MVADSLQVKLVKASNLPREARIFVPMNDQSFSCNQPQNLFRFTKDLYMLKGSSDPLVEAAPKPPNTSQDHLRSKSTSPEGVEPRV